MIDDLQVTLRALWRDEAGAALTTELMLLATLLVIGLIVGVKSYRDSAVTEWADFSQAIANLDQSYNIPDSTTMSGVGSGFVDARDFCDVDDNDSQTISSNDAFNDFPTSYIYYGVPATPE